MFFCTVQNDCGAFQPLSYLGLNRRRTLIYSCRCFIHGEIARPTGCHRLVQSTEQRHAGAKTHVRGGTLALSLDLAGLSSSRSGLAARRVVSARETPGSHKHQRSSFCQANIHAYSVLPLAALESAPTTGNQTDARISSLGRNDLVSRLKYRQGRQVGGRLVTAMIHSQGRPPQPPCVFEVLCFQEGHPWRADSG